MAEAKKLISVKPVKEDLKYPSRIKTPESFGGTLKELIQEFREETKMLAPETPLREPSKEGKCLIFSVSPMN